MVNKNGRASPRRLPNRNTSQYCQRANKRIPDQITLIDQWKSGVHGVKLWRRLTCAPLTKNYSKGLYGAYEICVCATAQPHKLTKIDGNLQRSSTCTQTVPTKPRTFQKMYHRVQSTKNNIVTAVQPVFLSSLVDQLAGSVKIDQSPNDPAFIQLLRGDRQNQPQEKLRNNDGAI